MRIGISMMQMQYVKIVVIVSLNITLVLLVNLQNKTLLVPLMNVLTVIYVVIDINQELEFVLLQVIQMVILLIMEI